MKNRVLSGFFLLFSIVAQGDVDSFHFSSVYLDDDKRMHFQGFYNEVLRFISADKMDYVIYEELVQNPESTDLQVYRNVAGRMSEVTPDAFESLILAKKALDYQKGVLGDQSKKLIPEKYEIDGYLEIGTAGIYIKPLSERLSGGIKGHVYLLDDRNPGGSDQPLLMHENSLPEYQYVPSRNHAPIAEIDIPTESLDMVTMYVGLHHTEVDKLDLFLESINRVLRIGGIFILREHDLTEISASYVHLAHMTFNLATQVTLDDELNEYRNFQPLQYWVELVEKHGFISQPEYFQQEGDPSENTLIRFTKIASPASAGTEKNTAHRESDFYRSEALLLQSNITGSNAPLFEGSVAENDLSSLIKVQNFARKNKSYLRPEDQSVLTVPEWWVVWNSQDYADFVQGKGSYHFPYFKSIGSYWQVYRKSLMKTKKANIGYHVINLFVGTAQSAEYVVKGAFDKLFVRKKRTNSGVTKIQREYSEFLKHDFFYNFPYSQKRREFNQNYARGDIESWMFEFEYRLKSYMAPLVKYISGSTYGEKLEIETVGMIVHDPEQELEGIDDRIEIVFSSGNYYMLKVPRYQAFTEIMLKLAQRSIKIEEVAGNRWIVLAIERTSR